MPQSFPRLDRLRAGNRLPNTTETAPLSAATRFPCCRWRPLAHARETADRPRRQSPREHPRRQIDVWQAPLSCSYCASSMRGPNDARHPASSDLNCGVRKRRRLAGLVALGDKIRVSEHDQCQQGSGGLPARSPASIVRSHGSVRRSNTICGSVPSTTRPAGAG